MQVFRQRFTGEAAPLSGQPEWMSRLLRGRGIDTDEKAEKFLHPSVADLHDPLLMKDMDRTLTLIRAAVRRGDRILVYGDYDVDGISACVILTETLRAFIRREGSDSRADYRIPRRHTEGYGLNEAAVREASGTYQMLITVDCGITSVREAALAKELGMTVIITDHHEPPETLPEGDAVMDPLLGDYPFRRLCGAGVALKICQGLLGLETAEEKLEIAALATVADIVPLTDENRVIVREGLRRMENTRRPGLRRLMENAKVNFPLSSEDIAFRLAPRLNAAGRLGDATVGVRLLMTEDPDEAREIADRLEESNRLRQAEEMKIISEAEALMATQTDLTRDRALILAGENWNSGLIGLAAGKLCERYNHPTVVLSIQGDKAVGSCRSIPGVHIWKMLSACGEDFFLRFGGHEQAAGLTLPTDRIGEFRRRLNAAIRESCPLECFLPVREYDSEMPLSEVTEATVKRLAALEPTGCGNPAPVFLARGAEVQECRRVGKDRSHLKIALLEGRVRMEGEARRAGVSLMKGTTLRDDRDRMEGEAQRAGVSLMKGTTLRDDRDRMEGEAQRAGVSLMKGTTLRDDGDRMEGMPLRDERALRDGIGFGLGDAADQMLTRVDVLFRPTLNTFNGRTTPQMQIQAICPAGAAEETEGDGFFLACLQEMSLLAAKEAQHPMPAGPALRPESRLKERLEEVDPSREALGKVYQALRKAEDLSDPGELAAACGVSREMLLAALTAFAQLAFLRWEPEPFHVELLPTPKRNLEESQLIRYLRRRQGDG